MKKKKISNIVKYKRVNNTSDLLELAQKISEELGYEEVCITPALDGKAVLLCSEEFFFRISGYASISIMFTQNGNDQEAVLVGCAGGTGLINHSYGSNKSMVKYALPVFEKHGFVMVE